MSQTRTRMDVVVGPGYRTSWALTTESRLSSSLGNDHHGALDDQNGHRRVCEVRRSPSRKPMRSGQALREPRSLSVVLSRQRCGRVCQRTDERAFDAAGRGGTRWRGDLYLWVVVGGCREGSDGLTASRRGRMRFCAWRDEGEGEEREREGI
jgi:hypothetical protein